MVLPIRQMKAVGFIYVLSFPIVPNFCFSAQPPRRSCASSSFVGSGVL